MARLEFVNLKVGDAFSVKCVEFSEEGFLGSHMLGDVRQFKVVRLNKRVAENGLPVVWVRVEGYDDLKYYLEDGKFMYEEHGYSETWELVEDSTPSQ